MLRPLISCSTSDLGELVVVVLKATICALVPARDKALLAVVLPVVARLCASSARD